MAVINAVLDVIMEITMFIIKFTPCIFSITEKVVLSSSVGE